MKVGNPIGSNTVRRGIVAVGMMWMLLAGSAAPLAAMAEPAPAQAAVEASGTVGGVDTTSALTAAVQTATVVSAAVATPKPAAAPVKKKKKRKKLTMRQLVAKAGRARGLSKAEVRALLWMAKRESTFHPRAVSRSGCYGLFQLSGGMAHGHPWRDPTWNTKRAIRYMRGRYGGVLHAQRFWRSHHWY